MKDFFKTDEAMIDLMIVAGIFILIYVSKNITPVTVGTVASGDAETGIVSFLGTKVDLGWIPGLFFSLQNVLGLLAVVLLAGIFLLVIRTGDIKKAENEKFAPVHTEENEAKAMQIQWQVVLNHVNSESPAEWKLAILEADSMLDEILDNEGYVGETLGEKLKAMSSKTIHSYDDLWEAHKVRNQIAHGGTEMELTKRTARDAVNKFEVAFKELGHI